MSTYVSTYKIVKSYVDALEKCRVTVESAFSWVDSETRREEYRTPSLEDAEALFIAYGNLIHVVDVTVPSDVAELLDARDAIRHLQDGRVRGALRTAYEEVTREGAKAMVLHVYPRRAASETDASELCAEEAS